MAVKLKKNAFEYAKELVGKREVVVDERDAWSEHQPSTQRENDFIDANGFAEYGKWHLGIDDEENKSTKKDANFLTEISRRFTAAQCFPPRVGQDNINALILNGRLHTYMA